MKYTKKTIIFSIALCSILGFVSCKTTESVTPVTNKPMETLEVRTLKTYYANVANVDTSKVTYDQQSDTFSIQNEYKISYEKLLVHYNNSLTGTIQ